MWSTKPRTKTEKYDTSNIRLIQSNAPQPHPSDVQASAHQSATEIPTAEAINAESVNYDDVVNDESDQAKPETCWSVSRRWRIPVIIRRIVADRRTLLMLRFIKRKSTRIAVNRARFVDG